MIDYFIVPLMKKTFVNETETKQALLNFIASSDYLSMGKNCAEFESAFSTWQGRKYGILFNSGGSANLALLQALQNMNVIQRGDNIAYSALTWSTNVMPIIQLGMQPIPIDCNLTTLNVSPKKLEERVKEVSIKALFLTNVLGFTDDIHGIRQVCKDHDILLIEDNCESLGTVVKGEKAGNFGLSASFSFYVAHHMSTIEGGMLCTDDEDLDEMLRMVRANGWDRNLTPSQQQKLRKQFDIDEFQANYCFFDLGYNLRPTEITGFLGLQQVRFLDDIVQQREDSYFEIDKVVKANSDFIPLDSLHIEKLSAFAFPFICKTEELRKKYVEKFIQAGVQVRPMIAGNMQKQPFYKKYVDQVFPLENTDHLHDCGFYCGNYPDMSTEDINTIKNIVQ